MVEKVLNRYTESVADENKDIQGRRFRATIQNVVEIRCIDGDAFAKGVLRDLFLVDKCG